MKFFDEFELKQRFEGRILSWPAFYKDFADYCNAKIEGLGMVVYGSKQYSWHEYMHPGCVQTHRALLICIEPIEKCTHPKEKVIEKTMDHDENGPHAIYNIFQCECGAKVSPSEFKEVK